MQQLRIVHTEASLGWGGQEWRVFVELKWMRDHGHQVWLFAPPQAQIAARAREAGIRVRNMARSYHRYPDQIAKLAGFFARRHIQVVNTHSSRDGWIGGWAARLAGVPLIIRSRHIEVDYGWKFLPALGFDYLPHEVLTTSDRIADRLATECHIPRRKIHCVPTGIDLSRFPYRGEAGPAGDLQRELGLAPGTPLVGMVSVLRSWKGHDDFLTAAAQLRAEGSPARFVIAGEGHSREAVEAKIKELDLGSHVTLLGYREDVPEILACLSALVLPSTAHEGVPQIVLQAQAAGCPVIGTRVGGIPEVIADGETGLLVPPENPPALAAAMADVLAHPTRAALRAETAYRQVVARHSLDHMGHRLERLYQQRLA